MLTQEKLKEYLIYNPDTGIFTHRISRGKAKAGDEAGTLTGTGYITTGIDKKVYKAHRLAWLYVHGKWPDMLIDHINGIRNDNRICNLREATLSQNMQNYREKTIRNTSGYLGVHFRKRSGMYEAKIRTPGNHMHLGYFKCPIEAHNAYLEAKRKYHEYCTI